MVHDQGAAWQAQPVDQLGQRVDIPGDKVGAGPDAQFTADVRGAQGLGGLTTVLDIKVRDYPTHAANLPVAIVVSRFTPALESL